jgi:F420H(2)-dependent quinone reductase
MGALQNPASVRNLLDHPQVELRDQTAKAEYIAHQASGDERAVWWKRTLDVWPDYAKYQTNTDRQIPVFVLEPVA